MKYEEFQRGFSVQSLPFGNSFSNTTVVGNNATAGTATNFVDYGLQLQNNNQYYSFTDTLYVGGLNAKYDIDRWHFTADGGYSHTTRNAIFLNEYTQAVYPSTTFTRTDGLSAGFRSNPGSPSGFTLGQSLTDPTLNYLTNLEIPSNGNGAPIIHDELYSAKGDVTYDLDGGFFRTVSAGARYTDRTKDLTQRTRYGSIDPSARAAIPASLMNSPPIPIRSTAPIRPPTSSARTRS